MALLAQLTLLLSGLAGLESARTRRSQKAKTIGGVPVYNYHRLQLAVKEKWILVAEDGVSDEELIDFCSQANCFRSGHQKGVPFLEVIGKEEDVLRVVKAAEGKLKFIELNGKVYKSSVASVEESYSKPWGLNRIGAPQRSTSGKGVHVYILDTGVNTQHEDFGGRAVSTVDMTRWVFRECRGRWWNCAADRDGHGTHCAGIVGGATLGVAPQATIHAVKTLRDDGSGDWLMQIDALDWIARKGSRPAVASMGLEGPGTSQSLQVAVHATTAQGVTVVVAAGNTNADACKSSPSFMSAAITVGSTTSSDGRSLFSNRGACVNIWAPGSEIRSATIVSNTQTTIRSGTSMACSHVSGAAALLLEADPKRTPKNIRARLALFGKRLRIVDLWKNDTNTLLNVGSFWFTS